MGFYYSDTKLPLRGKKGKKREGRKILPLRGKCGRRLQLLREFEPGRVYTFVPMYKLDDLPDETLLWADAQKLREDEHWKPRGTRT